jgi:hypothetical protein
LDASSPSDQQKCRSLVARSLLVQALSRVALRIGVRLLVAVSSRLHVLPSLVAYDQTVSAVVFG